MRIHELAKKLDIPSKDLVEIAKKLNIDVKSHMSALADEEIPVLEAKVKGGDQPEAKKPDVVSEEVKPEKVETPKKPGLVLNLKKSKETPSASAVPSDVVQQEEDQKKELVSEEPEEILEEVTVKMPITVGALATHLNMKTGALIKVLIKVGIFANVNQLLNERICEIVGENVGYKINKAPSEEENLLEEIKIDRSKNLEIRSPVVTLMGHVDHGKTSLLDAIRESNLASKESGKITQHIGAYEVQIPEKGFVTFLDTPGHEAFTSMRSRGANVTDVVVLVVAADDGVMPQTIEAIDHARAAEVPIIVAINKIDLPQANPDQIKTQLQSHGLTSEEWGGKTIFVPVSAKTGEGIPKLLEMLLLESEILELKANTDTLAQGTVIESRLTKSHGAVTSVLVQNGTLHSGDIVICGRFYGKIRAMHNDRGKNVKEAGPSRAVEIFGLNGVPEAADQFFIAPDEKTGRKISEKRMLEIREKELMASLTKHITLDDLFLGIESGTIQELNMIIKADVQGSIEAIQQSLEKIISEKIKLKTIHSGVGGINESDVMLATASDAIIIGFHVKIDPKAEVLIQKEGVDVRLYNIIYEVIQDVTRAMEGLLEPTLKEAVQGTAVVQQTFKSSKLGTIAGCMVNKGRISRNHRIRVIRDAIIVFDGKMTSLKKHKDDTKEVLEGFECGIVLDGFNKLNEGDTIEAYKVEKIATKLS